MHGQVAQLDEHHQSEHGAEQRHDEPDHQQRPAVHAVEIDSWLTSGRTSSASLADAVDTLTNTSSAAALARISERITTQPTSKNEKLGWQDQQRE